MIKTIKYGLIFLLLHSIGFAAVEFMEFTAVLQNSFVVLNWSTASETENLGFILERKTDSLSLWEPLVSYIEDDALRGQGTVSKQSDYTFTDTTVLPGEYFYRISGIDMSSAIGRLDSLHITVNETALNPFLPDQYGFTAFPNPFNPAAKIRFSLPESGQTVLSIFSLKGVLVGTLFNEWMERGDHVVTWHAGALPGGIYILSLQNRKKAENLKLILIK